MNKKLFQTSSAVAVKPTNTVNHAGGVAYKLSDSEALCQLALTGCFNNTFYATAESQLTEVLALAAKCDPQFVAKLAVYARENGLMKDTPAILAAVLASKNSELLESVFARVVDSPKMLRNFMQIVRSGATGRKSFGTRVKRLIQNYLENLTDQQLFNANVGNDPSLPDMIKMVHPKPSNKKRSALYGYLLGKEYNKRDLFPLAKEYEAFKKEPEGEIPDVPFQMLTALPLSDKQWKEIAKNATWTQTRMNLNTFLRHNVFVDSKMVDMVAKRLQDPELIKKAKVFPYQLFTASQNVDAKMPMKIQIALQQAADLALENVPEFNGKVYVLVDTSGSMKSAISGNRGSVTSKTSCVDVAALFASAIMRKNPEAEIIPFDTRVHTHRLNPLDSVLTNASALAKFGGGGTDCSIAINSLNKRGVRDSGQVSIFVISDNESWADIGYYNGTGMANEWKEFKKRNPKARLVCCDLTPNTTSQVTSADDVLLVGGFGDNVFEVISKFMDGKGKDTLLKDVNSVDLG